MGWGWRQSLRIISAACLLWVGAGGVPLAKASLTLEDSYARHSTNHLTLNLYHIQIPGFCLRENSRFPIGCGLSDSVGKGDILIAEVSAEEPEVPEAPSPWWLIVMPAIPLVGGGLIYVKRQWLNPAIKPPNNQSSSAAEMPENRSEDNDDAP